MKLTFRAFALLLMAALTLGSVTTTEARVPAKKNTAAKKRSTSGKGGGMSAAKLKNNKLICYNYGMEEGLMMKSSIGLDPSDIGWNFGFKVFGGNYSVVGNTLKVTSGSLRITATSTNGGRSFTGKFANGKNGAGDKCFLYNVTPQKKLTPEQIRKKLEEGTYTAAYIELYESSDNPILAFPATVKFVPEENPGEGEYKITADNVVMTALGILKGRYAFIDNTLMINNPRNTSNTLYILNKKDFATTYLSIPLAYTVIKGFRDYRAIDVSLTIIL